MKFRISTILAAVITVTILSLSVFPAAVTSGSQGVPDIEAGLTVIPARVVSEKSKVEVRCGIINKSASLASGTLTVEFFAEGKIADTQTISVKAGGSELLEYWWDPAGKKGCKVLGIRVRSGNTVIAEEYRAVTVVASETVGLPFATAAWEEPLAYRDGIYRSLRGIKKTDVKNQVNDMYELGIDTIVFCYSEFILYNAGAFYESKLPALTQDVMKMLNFDLLGEMLAAAEDRGMNILVGIGRGKDLFTPINEPEFSKAVDLAVSVMEEIYDLYGHYGSFYGWYISHEPSNLTASGELKFANAVVSRLRKLWPDKAVLLAPSGTPTMDRDSMEASQVDIFAFQDAVGAGYVPGQYTYDPENRIRDLDAAFASYKAVMDTTTKHFWSDLESWEMEGPNYENAYPALWSRVKRQFDIEKKYVSVQSMYAFTGFLASPDSTVQIGGSKAVDLFNGYKEFVDPYMQQHGIHNHTITDQRIKVTVSDLSETVNALPQMIEVSLSECGTKIKVPVTWNIPAEMTGVSTVTGKVIVSGIKKAGVTADITVSASSGSSSQAPSGTASSAAVSSSYPSEVSVSSSDSQQSEVSGDLSGEESSSSSLSVSSVSSSSDDPKPENSAESEGAGDVTEKNNWLLPSVIGAVVLAGAVIAVIFIIKRRKK